MWNSSRLLGILLAPLIFNCGTLPCSFQTDKPQTIGLPSVVYCADQFHLSANYLGDLIKKETGKTAQEHIHLKIMDLVKDRILDTSKSV